MTENRYKEIEETILYDYDESNGVICDENFMVDFGDNDYVQEYKDITLEEIEKSKREILAESWKDLDITSDFIFSMLMRIPPICKMILETLLGVKISRITYISYQKVIDLSYNSKSVRLDVFIENSNKIYNVEMQVTYNKKLALRVKYYHNLISLNDLLPGVDYIHMKEVYVIFICKHDPLGDGEVGYKVESHYSPLYGGDCKPFNDNTYTYLFNATSWEKAKDDNLKSLLSMVNGKEIYETDLSNILTNAIKKIKLNEETMLMYARTLLKEMEIRYMGIEKGREEGIEVGIVKGREEGIEVGRVKGKEEGIEVGIVKGREEGIEVGRVKGKEEGIEEGIEVGIEVVAINMLEDFSNEQIAKVTKMSIEEIQAIREKHTK